MSKPSLQLNKILKDHQEWLKGEGGKRADLRGADLTKANLGRAALGGADLRRANLIWANLSWADLNEANLIWANLSKANLIGANLRRADLIGANLMEADLRRANLIWADLNEANLIWADLSKANLSGANLRRADLSEANLIGANLSWADLNEANLSGANLNGADLRRAKIEFYLFPSIRLLSTMPLDGLSDKLTLELMRRDAYAHPYPERFDEWAKGGDCPYQCEETFWQFTVKRELWHRGNPHMADRDLILAICKEKGWGIRGHLEIREQKIGNIHENPDMLERESNGN